MRRGGYQVTDPTKQLKASLDAVKTRMRNQISDLKFQIATGKKIVRTKTAVAKDPEALALEKQRDELQAQFDAIFTKPGLTDEQRLRMAERSVDRQIASVRDQINSGAVFDKLPKKGVTSPALDAKKAELEALRQEREYMRQSLQPSPDRTRDSIRNAAARASLARRSADIQARMARGDFSPKAKPAPMQVDPETAAAKEKYERTVSEYRDAIRKDILSKRNIEEKVQDTFLRFRRAFILARLGVFGKLGAAAVTRIASVPLEDVAGGITNAVLPKGVTKGAQYEGGGFRTKALADAAAGAWMKTIDDAVKGFKTGRDQMEVLHGDGKTHDEDILPPSISNYIGRLHKVFKAPAKRFVYEHSFSRRMQWHIENTPGFNPADVESQMRIGNEAYKDANRAIFMADNKISDWFQRQISQLNQVNRKTGHADRTNKAIATAAQFLVPIVKVPTNIAAETLNHAFGLAIGSSKLGLAGLDGYRSLPEGEKAAPIKERLARSFQKGFEALTPDQKDIIVRHFKKGLVGGAMMTLGYFNPNAFGGYYQYGEKRDKGDVKWGGARVMGHDIPAWALEAPIIQAAQMGATIRRVADAKFNQGNSAIEKIGDGAMAAALGVIDATPLMNTVGNLGSLRGGDRGWKKFVGTAARDVAVPGFVQEAAQWTDRDAQGNEIERQPKQFRDYVGEGVPGLRQQVPVKGGVKKPSYRPPTRRLFSTPQSRR